MNWSWLLLASQYPLGRICLHFAAMARDGEVRWHWLGIRREFLQ